MSRESKNKEPRITSEIEDKCWFYLENGMKSKCYEYLKSLGFSDDAINYFFEVWYEGKSLFPYGEIPK